MHELSLCRSILRQALIRAEQEKASQIKSINLRIGALRKIDQDEILALFGRISRNTPAENAILTIRRDDAEYSDEVNIESLELMQTAPD